MSDRRMVASFGAKPNPEKFNCMAGCGLALNIPLPCQYLYWRGEVGKRAPKIRGTAPILRQLRRREMTAQAAWRLVAEAGAARILAVAAEAA